MTEKAEASSVGCWFDNGRGWRIAGAIVDEAMAWGYKPTKSYNEALKTEDDIDEWEFISDEAQDAEDWMNDHVAPKGYYFGYHPDWGDWGLYSALMDRMIGDLAGVGPVALEDFLDYMRELMPTAMVQYNRKLYFLQEILKDESWKGFPDFVDIVEENKGRDENKYSVTVKRA